MKKKLSLLLALAVIATSSIFVSAHDMKEEKTEHNIDAKTEATSEVVEVTDKDVKTEVRYRCSDKCHCAHKTLEEYNKCKCCKGKEPIAFTAIVTKAKMYKCSEKCHCKHLNLESYNACKCCKGKTPIEYEGEVVTEVFFKCSDKCHCHHRTMEEYNACKCCKDKPAKMYAIKPIIKSHAHQDKTETIYKCDEKCGCKHKTIEEYNSCECCKGREAKKFEVKVEEDKDENLKEIYKCSEGCNCKHKTAEECKECACCKGKEPKKFEVKDAHEHEEKAENKVSFSLNKKVYVTNGEEKEIDVEPFIKNDRIMVPLRYVGDSLGFTVEWNKEERFATLKKGDVTIIVPAAGTVIKVNGEDFIIDAEPEIKDGRIFLSISNIAKALGYKEGEDILWDKETKTATFIVK